MPYLVVIYGLIIVVVLVDIVTTDGERLRSVPKMVWVLLSMALPLVGPIAWLALGRPQKDGAEGDGAPNHDAPTGPAHREKRVSPDRVKAPSDPDVEAALFAAQVRARAEEQRRVAREQRDSEG